MDLQIENCMVYLMGFLRDDKTELYWDPQLEIHVYPIKDINMVTLMMVLVVNGMYW